MTGYVTAMSSCIGCKRFFSFNPMRVPSVTDFDRDPLDVIDTGDWVIVDADCGTVEIQKSRS